jgi:hypothetical protein
MSRFPIMISYPCLCWSGKHKHHGGNIEVISAPNGAPTVDIRRAAWPRARHHLRPPPRRAPSCLGNDRIVTFWWFWYRHAGIVVRATGRARPLEMITVPAPLIVQKDPARVAILPCPARGRQQILRGHWGAIEKSSTRHTTFREDRLHLPNRNLTPSHGHHPKHSHRSVPPRRDRTIPNRPTLLPRHQQMRPPDPQAPKTVKNQIKHQT